MRALVIMGVVLTCLACGASPENRAGLASTTGLVQSAYSDCNQRGQDLATYLATGEPRSNDPIYGNERQRVLALSGEARDLAIRQYADTYIQQCARKEEQAARQRQQAEAEAEAEAQAAARRAQATAVEQATCARVGGDWQAEGVCELTYRGSNGATYEYRLAFDMDGNLVAGLGQPKSAAECTNFYTGAVGHWHPDTMICSV